ncbi:Rieske-like 2Fe-2S protein [Algoriphagus antarcticus]|uniref:Rieske-like 2Fe-2S protein n=2 Tax=Algoriphagus antarcticus TaxID=238540 RepID=A0A3E0E1N3_9BACT|nr:Rieske 2Fe-2S domain-containing protein [Algoriphagus antarcticus]REG91550.1 Rieske-like 2Fe-2S protein [Algoriphagus antarcticus]
MEFLKSMGFKGASLLAIYCGASAITSCINEVGDPITGGPTGTGVDFTLDLTDSANAKLLNTGGYLIVNKIVVARVSGDAFAAVTQVCSHENKSKVIYRNNEFYCTEHGARYTLTGTGLNSEGKKGIKAYKAQLSGTSLHVFA